MNDYATNCFDLNEFYQNVKIKLDPNTIGHQEDGDHLIDKNRGIELQGNLKPAAVLIPILQQNDVPQVLLTTRTLALKSHSGQVAFPGGKIDDTDASPVATALREAHEEIGLHPDNVKILGEMPTYKSGSGYAITPVLGEIIGSPKLTLSPDEVEDSFLVPLNFLMNETNHILKSKVWNDVRRYYYAMPYCDIDGVERNIWGVTAGIIRRLYERLYL